VADATIGVDCEIHPGATIGHPGVDADAPVIGDNATIRSGTVIYSDVLIGDDFTTGHGALVREHTIVGDNVVVGTHAVIDGTCTVGSDVSIQTGVYVPTNSHIGDRVFLGPHAVLTNDPYPVRQDTELIGPTLRDDASVGANATILPGVTVGERSFVAAGAVVTEDVPPDTLAVGAPAEHRPLPETLHGRNAIE